MPEQIPQLYLTDFVEVVARTGLAKRNKISEIKFRPPYEPAHDFYKIFRETIIEAHEQKLGRTHLKESLKRTGDARRLAHYSELVRNYQSWWGRKAFKWFAPPRSTYLRHDVEIVVNPELGLVENGTEKIVKLHFKAEALSKPKMQLIGQLMFEALHGQRPEASMCILDIRCKKMHTPSVPDERLGPVLDAELAYIAALWPQL